MGLRKFLLSLYVLLTMIGIANMVSVVITANYLGELGPQIATATESVYAAEELRALVLASNRERLVRRLTGVPDPAHLAEELKEKDYWFIWIERYSTTPVEFEVVKQVKKQVNAFFAHTEEKYPTTTPVEAYLSLAPLVNAALISIDDLVMINRNKAEEFHQRIVRANRRHLILGGSLLLILLLLLFYSGNLLHRLVYIPLSTVKETIDQFRKTGTIPMEGTSFTIRELQLIEDALEEMVRTIQRHRKAQLQSIAGIAHDIRNPLAAIQSVLRLLRNEKTPAEKRKELMLLAEEKVLYLSTLLNHLMQTASIEAGHVPLTKKETDLAGVIRNLRGLYSSVSEKHTIVAELPESCVIFADPERMTQIFSNLMSNAIKYSPQGGRVEIVLRELQEAVEVTVSDEGIGIAAADRERIFEAFSRVESVAKAIEGMGLGLSVVRRLVEAHEGKLEVESTPGEGSLFRVLLPRTSSDTPAQEKTGNA